MFVCAWVCACVSLLGVCVSLCVSVVCVSVSVCQREYVWVSVVVSVFVSMCLRQ